MELPEEVVTVAYRSLWEFSASVIAAIPIKDLESEEDFKQHRVSVNIHGLGKLYTTWDRIVGLRERYNLLQELKNDKEKTSTEED